MLMYILLGALAVVIVLYLMRRRTRLNKDQ
ncbi:MAG: hypothetical protein H6Q33_1457 [Deltaproteobacteria bacterium]|nr:hypothetical protein [Deltaproteobacteria bacterium]